MWEVLGAFARAFFSGFLPVSERVEVEFAPFTVVITMCVILFALLGLLIVLSIFTSPLAWWVTGVSPVAEVHFLSLTYGFGWFFWHVFVPWSVPCGLRVFRP